MNFDESVNYLYNLGNEVLAMKLGLENIRILLAALGNPERKYLKIQIAGTNGKGSTCAFLEAICLAAKIKVGMTTSPHLISVTERVRIGGSEISEKDFAKYATIVRETSEKLVRQSKIENRKSKIFLKTVPTYFEQVTAIALLAFVEAKINLAILETGLGGRFDATTAANAEIAAITPIDFDHEKILGDTLEKIAAEKAAIIREKMPVVIAAQKPEVMRVLNKRCRAMNVVPLIADCAKNNEFGEEFFSNIQIDLIGEHQKQNACVAVKIAEILRAKFKFQISNEQIAEGLKKARHKGRLEWQKIGNLEFLFDGAHNQSGARALKYYLETLGNERKITMIFGAMKDKNLDEIAAILFPLAENLIVCEPENPRSETVANLQLIAEKFVAKAKIFSVKNVADAIETARRFNNNESSENQSFVCVTGSLYLVGEAQKILKNNSLT